MFNQITFFLFRLNLIQPSQHAIRFWMETEQVEKLEYALKFGNYKTRPLAANALGAIGCHSSIPVLFDAINDKIQNVSIAALNALEQIGCEDELGAAIIRKRFNWVKEKKRKANKRHEANKNYKHTIFRWERASKKSFDRVKEQLKRPMR